MATLKIVIPDATVNYITNPAMRYDTTGWNVQGSTVTRTLERARFGVASLQVVTDGAALNEGAYFRVSALDGISDVITISVYLRGAGRVRLRLDDNAPGGKEYVGEGVDLNDDRWTRVDVFGRCHGGDDLRLYVELAESAVAARTFYVDGAQMERKPYPTTYCDGGQEGCRWNGVYHASTSSRPSSTRAGGRWVELSGEEREAQDLYMTVAGGLGMAPLSNNVQSFALAAGGYQQNVKVNMRPITFTFHARYKKFFTTVPASLEKLHELRQLLIDLIKPDRTGGDEALRLCYQDGDVALYFQAHYDGGLEGEWDVRNGNVNSFPLRVLGVNPYFVEDDQEAQALDFQTVQEFNNAAARIDGEWKNLNYGFDYWPATKGYARGPRGEIYAAAYDNNLTVANNNAAAIDPLRPVRALMQWDGEKWNAIGAVTNMGGTGIIYSIAVHPNGDVYVTGDFTSIGGVAANYIAYWDGSTWNALGSGLGTRGRDLVIAPNGDIYVGGDFTTAGGNAAYRVAKWDGGTWTHLGPYQGLNAIVNTLDISEDGTTLYLGGTFTDEQSVGGTRLFRAAYYNISAATFSPMGDGFDDSVSVMRVAPDGKVYAVGDFDASGSESIPGIGVWNGGVWKDVGNSILSTEDPNSPVVINKATNIGFFENGNLVAVGNWDLLMTIALWNGSTWLPYDISIDFFRGVGFVQGLFALAVTPENDVFVGLWGNNANSRPMLSSGINTVNNPGTTACRPKFFIQGPATLRWIENQTAQKTLYLNIKILDGESVTIDIGSGTMESDIRGSLLYGLVPGSDFRDFVLLPGDNKLACFMVDDVAAQMSVQFTPRHWSADATGKGASL